MIYEDKDDHDEIDSDKYKVMDPEVYNKLKRDTRIAFDYFKGNNDQFNFDKDFLYNSTLSEKDRDTLELYNLPELEFNSLEPIISGVRGEFAKMQPELQVASISEEVRSESVAFYEGHLRHLFCNNREFADGMMTNILSGFASAKIDVEYESEKSMKLVLKVKPCRNSLLVFYDPLATKQDKSDANYVFEFIPIIESDIKRDYPGFDYKSLKPLVDVRDIEWLPSMTKDSKKIYYVCHVVERKKEEMDLYLVEDITAKQVKVMYKDEYHELLKRIEESESGRLPPIVIKSRPSTRTYFMEYSCIGDRYLTKPHRSPFTKLRYIFFDCNSVTIKGVQKTRSFIHNAKDWQRVKNIVGVAMLNQVTNLRQADLLISESALPTEGTPEFLEAWKNPQSAQTAFVWRDVDENGKPNERPQYFTPGQINPVLLSMFSELDTSLKYLYGSHDPQVGFKGRDLSGAAIQAGASLSKELFKPVVLNYLNSLERIGNVVLDMLPLIYHGKRKLPVLDEKGFIKTKEVNTQGENTPSTSFNPGDVKVKLKAGLNFEAQKERSLQMATNLMAVDEEFRGFMNQELVYLIENMDLRQSDMLKEKAQAYSEKRKQIQEQAAKNPPPNPQLLAVQSKIQDDKMRDAREREKMALDHSFRLEKLHLDKGKTAGKLTIDAHKLENEDREYMLKLIETKANIEIAYEKADKESERSMVMLMMNQIDKEIEHYKHITKISHEARMQEREHMHQARSSEVN